MAAVGDRYGPYTCIRKIGEGGMAETYLAHQAGPHGFEQRVCIKLIREDCKSQPKFVEMFIGEATVAASLRHSNIVSVIDASQEQGYMVLELVDGVDLRTLVQATPGRRLASDLVTYIALELVKALDFAHNRRLRGKTDGLVHRDIKPSNVLISYAGEVKLADFGIAKAIRSAGDTDGLIKGTPCYMSPEQARGEPQDARGDLFSLGILLYEMLAGQRPFDGTSDTDTVRRICLGEYTPLAEAAPDAPAGLASVIEKLLRPDRDQRFQSAQALGAALDRFAPLPSTYRRLGVLAREARPPETLVPSEENGLPVLPQPVSASSWSAPAAVSPPGEEPPGQERIEPAGAGPRAPAGTATPTVPSPFPAETQLVSQAPDRDASAEVRLRISRPAKAAAALAAVVAAVTIGVFASVRAKHPAGETRPAVAAPIAPASAAPPAIPAENPRPAAPQPATEETARSSTPRVETSGEESSSAHRKTHKAPAFLQVGVFPWGKVWIDGQPRGTAPVHIEISAGAHTVSGGMEQPTVSKTVVLRPGKEEQVVIDLNKQATNQ